MGKSKLPNKRVEAFGALVKMVIKNNSRYMKASNALKSVLPYIKEAKSQLGDDKINLIYDLFCLQLPEYASVFSKNDFIDNINSLNGKGESDITGKIFKKMPY